MQIARLAAMQNHPTKPPSANPSNSLQWRVLPFTSLTLPELYVLLQLRTEVFVLEQNCVFQDMDGADTNALHVLGTDGGAALMAYARLFPAGVKFSEASIGRVVTHSHVRGSGIGHVLIQQALEALAGAWGLQPIRIGAQAHLKNFYQQHGFVDVGMPYVEDGIDHLEMLRQP